MFTQASTRTAVNNPTTAGSIPQYVFPKHQIYFCGDAEAQNCFVEVQITPSGVVQYKRRNNGFYSFGVASYIV